MKKGYLMTMEPGQVVAVNGALVRYDGAYDWIDGEDKHTYTLVSHYIDKAGADRFMGSFALSGLVTLGVLQ